MATPTPARPDRNWTGLVPADFFSILQSSFLSCVCSVAPYFEGNLKELVCLTEKTEMWQRKKAGQNLVVNKSSLKFPSNFWHDTRSLPAFLQFTIWCHRTANSGKAHSASVCKIVKTVPKKPLLFCQTTATWGLESSCNRCTLNPWESMILARCHSSSLRKPIRRTLETFTKCSTQYFLLAPTY